MGQLVAIVAVFRLAILKRMPATPLTLLAAHRLREQVKAQSPEKWKDEDLGWFPNPKGEYTEFSNSILPKFYLSFWTTCPYKERFRHCFVTERKRQWEVHEALKAINHRDPPPPETSKYGRKRTRVERDNYPSWEKIVF